MSLTSLFKLTYVRFIGLFCFFYFGTYVMIGLAAPGGYYSPFVEHYLNYISWLRMSVIHGSAFMLKLFGYLTTIEPDFTLRILNGKHVIVAYDCAGYGVLSFWIAYILSVDKISLLSKFTSLFLGCFLLWMINCFRISLYLLARNSIIKFPFQMDHHLFFNIIAYLMIGALIIFQERMIQKKLSS